MAINIGGQQFNARFKLKDFKGEKDDTTSSWLRKFNKEATGQDWRDAQKCKNLDLYMDDAADSWFSTLPAAKQNNWDQLEEAFDEQFIEFEPAMVTESKHSSRI